MSKVLTRPLRVLIQGKDQLGKAKYVNVTESGDLRVQLSGTVTEMRDVWQATVTAGSTGWLEPLVKTPAPPFVITVRADQMISHDWGVIWRHRGIGDSSHVTRIYRDSTRDTFSVDTAGDNLKANTVALFVDKIGANHFNLRFNNNEEYDVNISVDIIKW